MTQSRLVFKRFRSQLVSAIRHNLEKHDFEEVHTPLLVDEVNTEPHIEYYRLGERFLIASPELGLKDFLFDIWAEDALAKPKIYQLGPVFRSGPDEFSRLHRNEFLMAEYYHPAETLEEGVAFFLYIIESVFHDFRIAKLPTIRHMSISDLFFQRTGKELDFQSTESFLDILRQFNPHSSSLKAGAIRTWNDLFFEVYVSALEPWMHTQEFLVLTHFPRTVSSMARPSETPPGTVERFEVYFRGIELCNGYIECFRPDVIRAQMIHDEQNLTQKRAIPTQWLKRLEQNWIRHEGRLPTICGVALGIERLGLALYQMQREGLGPGIGIFFGEDHTSS